MANIVKMAEWKKIILGLIAGIAAGIIFDEKIVVIEPLGKLFIRLIKMLIIPLVLSSLVVGIYSIRDIKKLGKIGGKTIIIFLGTTLIAVVIGMLMGYIIQPGEGLQLSSSVTSITPKKAPPISDVLLDIFPTNIFGTLVDGNILQVISFAVFLGISLMLAGEKGKPVIDFFEGLAEVMYKMTGIVMKFAPLGIFALIAPVAGSFGPEVLLPLGKMVIAVYLACLIMLLVYSFNLIVFANYSPAKFFRNAANAIMVAFTTSSSSATLPTSMKVAEEEIGISNSIASFVLPLGATINMDGGAIYQGLAAIFVTQIYGIDISVAQQLTIILTAILASIGTAGVPGAGIIMLSLVLESVGLPLEAIALVAGIERILDMGRTAVNVTGDLVTATIIDSREKGLNKLQAVK